MQYLYLGKLVPFKIQPFPLKIPSNSKLNLKTPSRHISPSSISFPSITLHFFLSFPTFTSPTYTPSPPPQLSNIIYY